MWQAAADEISDDEDVYGDPIEKHWDEEEEREISTKRDLYPGPELEEEESDAEDGQAPEVRLRQLRVVLGDRVPAEGRGAGSARGALVDSAGAFLQQVADDGEPGVGRVRLLGLEPHRRAVRPARSVALVERARGVPAQSSGWGALRQAENRGSQGEQKSVGRTTRRAPPSGRRWPSG